MGAENLGGIPAAVSAWGSQLLLAPNQPWPPLKKTTFNRDTKEDNGGRVAVFSMKLQIRSQVKNKQRIIEYPKHFRSYQMAPAVT